MAERQWIRACKSYGGDGERILFRGSRPGRRRRAQAYPGGSPPPRIARRPWRSNGWRTNMSSGNELDGVWAARAAGARTRRRSRHAGCSRTPGGRNRSARPARPADGDRAFSSCASRIGVAVALGQSPPGRPSSTRTRKPGNILVNCADGAVRLTGFGIATRLPRERRTLAPPRNHRRHARLYGARTDRVDEIARSTPRSGPFISLGGRLLIKCSSAPLPFNCVGFQRSGSTVMSPEKPAPPRAIGLRLSRPPSQRS